MRDPDDILTTVRPQDRIPSHGQQLTVDGTPGPARRHPGSWPIRSQACTDGNHPRCRDARARTGAAAYCVCECHQPKPAPVTLNLWDQSADSLPETWSTPR